ncbi:unnamed protein product, partial [Amoebophrya sp. A25]
EFEVTKTTIQQQQPIVLGLYGISCSGKTHILKNLRVKYGSSQFLLFDGSSKICSVLVKYDKFYNQDSRGTLRRYKLDQDEDRSTMAGESNEELLQNKDRNGNDVQEPATSKRSSEELLQYFKTLPASTKIWIREMAMREIADEAKRKGAIAVVAGHCAFPRQASSCTKLTATTTTSRDLARTTTTSYSTTDKQDETFETV